MAYARRRTRDQTEEDSYFISMTDILVGLLFIFIIIIMFFAYQLTLATQERETYADDAKNHRVFILRAVKQALENEGITNVEIDENQGILRLPEGVLFKKQGFKIEEESKAKEVATKLAKAFEKVLKCSVFNKDGKPRIRRSQKSLFNCWKDNAKQVFIDAIFIEGHTDNDPIKEKGLKLDRSINSNLRLSARRATNTFKVMTSQQPKLTEFYSPKKYPIFAVSSYGETRPVRPNKTKEDKAFNRRIDFRFLMYVPGTNEALRAYKRRLADAY